MTFFNKKEEVLDIELTPHGKGLLSQGKFRPSYYLFFDKIPQIIGGQELLQA